VVGLLLVVAALLSGFSCNLVILGSSGEIFTREEMQFGNWIAENTPLNATFLTAGTTHDPAATVGGRQLFEGYVGWVVSHGLESHERGRKLQYLMHHCNDSRAFVESDIAYVVESLPDFAFPGAEESGIWDLEFDAGSLRLWKLSLWRS
jgi:hypothetical protein